MSDQPDPKTMEVLYDFLRDAPERQIDNGESLDAKMVQIFGAASVVIGLAGFSSGGIAPDNLLVTTLLILAVIAYVATGYIAFRSISPKLWRRSLNADSWWTLLWDRNQDEARHAILADLAKSYAENRPILAAKAQRMYIVLATTGIEVVLIGLALIFARAG